MRWPFVSRARYDLLARNYEEATARRDASLAECHARVREYERMTGQLIAQRDSDGARYGVLLAQYSALLEKYHSLRVIGAVEMPTLSTAPIVSTALNHLTGVAYDELRALIHERAGSDYRKRAMMLRQLAADRAANRSEDDIRAEIEHGVQSDGVPA